MRSTLYRWVLMSAMAGGTLIGSNVSAQPTVRDHRDRKPDDRYDDRGPREAPPPPRAERAERRKGFVWVSGSWDWKGGRWDWTPGHFEAQRVGKKFIAPRWEKKGDIFVRVDGTWGDAGAPPPPRDERLEVKPGFVFLKGHWDWDNGEWTWVAGRWERERAGSRWREDRWDQRNGEWILVGGGWEAAPVAAYPTAAPPPNPRDVIPRVGPTEVYIPGHFAWKNGRYEWQSGFIDKHRPGFRFEAGTWVSRNGRFEWTDGRWVEDFPRNAPPADPYEPPQTRPNQVWVPGFYKWSNGAYVWEHGHFENVRPSQRFERGHWEKRGDRWAFVEGTWVNDQFPHQPPPPRVVENPGRRPGQAFALGYYRWANGRYEWQPGRWVAGHANEVHVPHEWVQRGDHYEMVNDRWEPAATTAPPPPPPPNYGGNGPRKAPPAPREERYEEKKGFIWARGHWEWKNGDYEWLPGHWERERASKRWVEARWEQRGDSWFFTDGHWE